MSHLITDEVLQQVNAIHLMEAELTGLTARLNNWTPFKQQLEYSEENPKAYWQRLTERRTTLLQELRSKRQNAEEEAAETEAPPAPVPIRSSGAVPIRDIFIKQAFDIPKILQPCPSPRSVPIMTDGISETPGVEGTEGEIKSLDLGRGGLVYGGTLLDLGRREPLTEKFWVHNWRCVIRFPTAPELRRLWYRFSVSSEANINDVSVLSGSVRTFVTVGTTNDVNRPIRNWETVGWPVDVTLPLSPPWLKSYSADVPVEGIIHPRKGQSAAIGLIFGVIVGVASGRVSFSWGNFGTRRTKTTYGASDYGLIEYCFIPAWLEDVNRIIKAEGWEMHLGD